MTTISLQGMKFNAPVGYHDEEQLLLNEMVVSVEMELINNAAMADFGDDIGTTVNYEEIYNLISAIMASPVKLIETAVNKIMTKIAEGYPSVKKIIVRVEKKNPPLKGRVSSVWVQDEWVRI